MAGRAGGNETPPAAPRAAINGGGFGGDDSTGRGDHELRRMAAFRIRETANRIATLAQNAEDETLRRSLLGLCQRLVQEQRLLLGETE
jgi:hypothetical protein